MSYEKMSNDDTKEYTARSDQNLFGLWGATGSEWTSSIKEECLSVTEQSLEKGKSGSTRSIVALGTLAVLALLGTATMTQASVAPLTRQENVRAIPSE